jgi:hypothetical protein
MAMTGGKTEVIRTMCPMNCTPGLRLLVGCTSTRECGFNDEDEE